MGSALAKGMKFESDSKNCAFYKNNEIVLTSEKSEKESILN